MKRMLLVLVLAAGGCFVGVAAPPFYLGVDVPVSVRWELIPGTTIYYTDDLGADVFFYGGRYYRVVNGVWYVSSTWTGGWRLVRAVPEVFLWIPPTHPCYRVVVYHPLYYRYHVVRPGARYVVPAPPAKKAYKGKKGTDERVGGGGGSWIKR